MPGLHDAGHEETTSPHVAERGSLRRRMLPTRGIMDINIKTRHRLLGSAKQQRIATHSIPSEIAPDGAVKSIVWNLS